MKGRISFTVHDIEEIQEYIRQRHEFKSPGDLAKKAVYQYMRQYKNKPKGLESMIRKIVKEESRGEK